MYKKVSLKELKAECESYGLKYYGSKDIIINRIQKHKEKLNESPKESNEAPMEFNEAPKSSDSDKVSTDSDDCDDDHHENEQEEEQIILINVPSIGGPNLSHSIHSSNSNSSYKQIDNQIKKRTRIYSTFSIF